MLQGKEDLQLDNHDEIIRTADEALSTAEQAIRVAREKLRIARKNYIERMRLPTGAKNGQPNSS
jgi:hypothetical protein